MSSRLYHPNFSNLTGKSRNPSVIFLASPFLANGQETILIDLMIIGVAKAGTTALFRHLARSPKIYAHKAQEMTYFWSNQEYQRGWEEAVQKYFPGYRGEVLVAKDVMTSYSRPAMERLKAQCPGVKCLLILRDPAARAYSAFHHARLRGIEDCECFEEALQKEPERARSDPEFWASALYIRNSSYAEPLANALEIFGRQNVLVLFQSEYRDNPQKQLAKVEKFIGQSLFDSVDLEFAEHNRAAAARYPRLARYTYRFYKSRSLVRRTLRRILPHRLAVTLRMALENFNRRDTSYPPMRPETADSIRKSLAEDRDAVVRLVGYCPW